MSDLTIQEVEWSSEAVVIAPDGTHYPLFQQHTFAAKILFTSGHVRVVVCPIGAALSSHKEWDATVRKFARDGLSILAYHVLILEGDPLDPANAKLRTT